MSESRTYGVLLDGTTAIKRFPRLTATGQLAGTADWTPSTNGGGAAASDLLVSKDGGALTNATNLPVYNDGAWDLIFTATELACKHLAWKMEDRAGALIFGQGGTVETTADPLSMWPDSSDAAPIFAQLSTTGRAAVASDVMAAALPVSGTARAATATTLQLATDESPVDDAYVGWTFTIVAGKGAIAARTCVAYVGSTRTATLLGAFLDIPDTTSEYVGKRL